MSKLFYIEKSCPNCGGIIDDYRLGNVHVCDSCLEKLDRDKDLCSQLEEEGKLQLLKKFCKATREVENFKKVFTRTLSGEPSSLQINWAKRFFLGDSFAIVAPTGSGKSTFGQIMAILNDGKTLIILPTKLLVTQFYQKIVDYTGKSQINRKILKYSGHKKEKELLESGEFDVFICTTAFFHKNFNTLSRFKFSYVFVDDVDSFLKSGKNIENLFRLIGFSDEDIRLGLKTESSPEYFAKLDRLREKVDTRLIVSSATLKPKTNRAILFQNLLGFEITRFNSALRKIEDYYIQPENQDTKLKGMINLCVEMLKRLKEGGILFVEEELGREFVDELTAVLRQNRIKAKSYLEEKEEKLLKEISSGNVELVVGLAHLSNPLLRGVDLPEILRYVVFFGVPKTKFRVDNLYEDHRKLYNVSIALMPLFDEEEKVSTSAQLNYLRKILHLDTERIEQNQKAKSILSNLSHFLKQKLSDNDFLKRLAESEEVFVEFDREGNMYIVAGNAQVYVQGSGRVSRLTSRGLLPGLSIIISDSQKALNSLKKRLKYYTNHDIDIPEIDLGKLEDVDRRIKEERASIQQTSIDFKSKLVIVESPHKAKTIASFFGKPAIRRVGSSIVYEIPTENSLLSITASLGHVIDLVKNKGIYGVLREESGYFPVFDYIKIDRQNSKQYTDDAPPDRGNIFDKRNLILSIQKLAFSSDEIYIASDPDAEGEKIAYDLLINLMPFQQNIKRLEFHEITRKEFEKALQHPQDINLSKVKAQLSRRVADRWVGFSLSQELWKIFNKTNLSAGRVQTPVLGWIIERTKESRLSKYRVSFYIDGENFSVEVEDKNLARQLLANLDRLVLEQVKREVIELSPPPPYTTDTVLEDAFNFFRFPADYTMRLLQEMFEMGLITYHRTDSTRISEAGRYQVAKPYISSKLGEEYFTPREWFSAGAHEGIRPTKPWDTEEIRLRAAYNILSFENPRDSFRLYSLIFNRFMASQTRKTKAEKTEFLFKTPVYSWQQELITQIVEDGYERFYNNIKVVKLPQLLDVKEGKITKVSKIQPFTQASLIQQMKQKKLGRPSTYAEIVSTLLQRRYVYQLKNGFLVSTKLGTEVYKFLSSRFKEYISEEFTRKLEQFMDEVERGEREHDQIFIQLEGLLKTG